ncbi:MAG TPA: RsmE family RNA methyltransferase [Candidatus Paceibacterota bacterium]|nr:RsmE family RNA methyltransferase [Candidatus Paceibacterota bacterium]
MRLHRFYIKTDLSGDKITIVDKETINQIKNVFRLRKGDQFMIFNDKKEEVVATIKNISSDELSAEVSKKIKNDSEPQNKVNLYLSILKKENFELVVQKATEVGVSKIIPVISARTVKMNLNIERLQKIAKEAAEQCGRQNIPEISEPIKIREAFEEAAKNGVTLFFDRYGEDISTWKPGFQVNIFIGAEGGWDEWEVELAKEKGFHIASLGKLTLRGETAAIIATYLAVK